MSREDFLMQTTLFTNHLNSLSAPAAIATAAARRVSRWRCNRPPPWTPSTAFVHDSRSNRTPWRVFHGVFYRYNL